MVHTSPGQNMNTSVNENHIYDNVLNGEAEKHVSSAPTIGLGQQLEESTHNLCRKRPPGGISMFSTVISEQNIVASSPHLMPHEDDMKMNGTQESHLTINNRPRMSAGTNKTTLKDDHASSAKQIGKPLDGSEVVSDSKKLLTFQQIPTYLRFNRFVLSHYRAPANWKGCLKSLCYMHNETINILTHAIPLVVILAFIPWLLPYDSISVPYLPIFHVIASLAPWIGSIVYHIFMNHENGCSVYKAVLTIDMLGIWTTQTTGGLITICATIYCLDKEIQTQFLTAYAFLCLYCLHKAMTANDAWGRRFAFTAPLLVRISMVALRAFGRGGGHVDSFSHVILQDLISVVGAFIGATNIPERWFPPGAMDLFCNSHHVMHVLVVYAVYHMHAAAVLDLGWMSDIEQEKLKCSSDITSFPSISEILGYL